MAGHISNRLRRIHAVLLYGVLFASGHSRKNFRFFSGSGIGSIRVGGGRHFSFVDSCNKSGGDKEPEGADSLPGAFVRI